MHPMVKKINGLQWDLWHCKKSAMTCVGEGGDVSAILVGEKLVILVDTSTSFKKQPLRANHHHFGRGKGGGGPERAIVAKALLFGGKKNGELSARKEELKGRSLTHKKTKGEGKNY